MVLSIKHPEADRLARELARRQKKSITDAVVDALNDAVERERRRLRRPGLADRLMEIGARYSALPKLTDQTDDEILGYNDRGLPE